jgi:hypothetical protein
MKFKLLGGTHEQYGTLYQPGDIIETDLRLDKLFKNKFERVGTFADEPPKKKKRKKTKKKVSKKVTVRLKKKEPRGEEVTKDFEVELQDHPWSLPPLKVFKRGFWYYIYEGDEQEPIHPKGLKKDAVLPRAEAWMEE